MKHILLLSMSYILLSMCAVADVKPSSMFGDHMVLQREMAVPVWGHADPGEKIQVEFAGHTVSTVAGKDGRWRLDLPVLKASAQPRELKITGQNEIIIKDVLVGEVWICSGQSNMQYGWGKSSHPMFNWGGDADLAALADEARTRPIRSYMVPTNVSFEPEDNCKGKWSTDVSGSAVAFGFSYYLQEVLHVPVAVIVTCWGSSSIEGWMPIELTDELPHFKEMMNRFQNSEQAQARVRGAMEKGIRHGMVFVRKQPNLLYNAMLHPVIPYGCRGIVWYQGEANANKPEEYRHSFPVWLKRLRKGWEREDLHLLAVMLPGYGPVNGPPDANSWAAFRDAQLSILTEPHTSVVNTIDLGDTKNIHPSDKNPICLRLAKLAQKDVYEGNAIVGRGPVFAKAVADGDRLLLSFSHANVLRTTDGKSPRGFWLLDKEDIWHEASAVIHNNRVEVKAEGVNKPQACRYAWTGKPDVNLINNEGQPAYPFKTD